VRRQPSSAGLPALVGRGLALFRDTVSRRRTAEKRIDHLAHHDALTGLPNRVLFGRRLEEALAGTGRGGTGLSLLMLDLDNMKEVNDTLGHDAGDALLKETAARLLAMTRPCDTVARFGGDEFGIILAGSLRPGQTSRYADKALRRLRQPFSFAGRRLIGHASIGLAIFPDHGTSSLELMKNADIALYRAKAGGRDQAVTYSPEMRREIEVRTLLKQETRKALAGEQFVPFYQPKVSLSTNRVIGFEALARWQHPARGLLTPASFEIALHDAELAAAIGWQIMRKVVSDMRHWLDAGLDFGRVAVNLSAVEFERRDLADEILGMLETAGVPPLCLEVEVTETVLLGSGAAHAGSILKQLCERGIQVALDDFGTGYASLTHLKRFPVDHVKIDRSFIQDLERDADDEAIVAAVIGLGQSLNLHVTAEGVETTGQAARLRDLGCHSAQGFLYAAAMPASEVPGFLAAER